MSYFSEFPVKELSHERGGKHKVTVHGATRGLKAYIQWGAAWFPKGTVNCHYTSAMQPSARYLPPWLGQTLAPLASVYSCNPQQGIPSTPVTASHVTQGTDLHVTLGYGRGVGFMGGMIRN